MEQMQIRHMVHKRLKKNCGALQAQHDMTKHTDMVKLQK